MKAFFQHKKNHMNHRKALKKQLMERFLLWAQGVPSLSTLISSSIKLTGKNHIVLLRILYCCFCACHLVFPLCSSERELCCS
jgi:hypothetical protein